MMRRRYFSALMFTAVLVFASPAGKTMASQVSENQTQSIAENVNVCSAPTAGATANGCGSGAAAARRRAPTCMTKRA